MHPSPVPTRPDLACVLVANRGEIARRIIRTLRRLGIRSVAVYSDADADAPHVGEADHAERIGPAAASASYLDVDAVIAAAERSGSTAIHPGYGFLAEHARFAQRCEAAGIVFIGPSVRALEIMGNKIRAKAHVAAHGVAIVPGTTAAGLDDDAIIAASTAIGFPLLVKPSAGGGGKGMTVVRMPSELPDALVSARRIARQAFGDDALLLERLVERPRHIEVQVLADTHGDVVHLGERECTLQRRHQKVVEESPSPAVTPRLRERLGAAAIAVARSVDYVGVGTVEFLVPADEPDTAYFIEMNTRLQVEHPVTELVTGVDLVEQQLRVAAGERLSMTQADVQLTGWAIEARVYAEDAARGFVPGAGRVLRFEPAAGARTDAAVRSGSVVTCDYDPMLAKVIAHGPTRQAALTALDDALADTVVLGVPTTIGFVRDLLADPAVRSGDLDTGLIGRRPAFTDPEPDDTALRAAAAVVAAGFEPAVNADAGPLWRARSGWRPGRPAAGIRIVLRTGAGQDRVVPVAPGTEGAAATAATAVADDGSVWVHVHGEAHRFEVLDRRTATRDRIARAERRPGAVDPHARAPMPGAVVAVHVADGQAVAGGERLCTIEAMKMEHPVVSPAAGVVRLRVAVGAQVSRDDVVATVEPTADADESDHEEDPCTPTI